MVEKSIREEIYHSTYWYAKANKKYMKDYEKNKKLSYIQYWDVNNSYGWTMLQKRTVNNLEWIEDVSQLNEDFIKSYNKESDKRYFFETDVQFTKKLPGPHSDLPFLPERIKIEKGEKIAANWYDKSEYVIHIRNLKQAWNLGLVFKKFIEWLNLIKMQCLAATISWYEQQSQKKKQNMILKKIFLCWWITQLFKKL